MKSTPTPDEFREYLGLLSEAEFSQWEDDELITKCLEQGSPYREIWDENQAINDALSSLSVPEPKRSIATSVMASIAAESIESQEKSATKGFSARVIELVQWEFRVPAWAAACLLIFFAGSLFVNLQVDGSDTIIPEQQMAGEPQQPELVPVDPLQNIQVIPQYGGNVISVSDRGGAAFPLNAPPSMIIIMGAPPSSLMSDLNSI